MGRSRNKRNNGHGHKKDRNDSNNAGKGNWGMLPNTNRFMREYYLAQEIESDREGYEDFWMAMGDPLPSTLRLNALGRSADVLRHRLKTDLAEGYPVIATNEEKKKGLVSDVIEPPVAIAWYPEQNAWRLGSNKMTIRKVKALAPLKQFLISEANAGNIVRQEEASMIPPFFLGVQRNHVVLDMCASPGSKTTQLVEALHADDAKHNFALPTGMVFANDVNVQRAYMLVNRLKNHASPNVIFTAHDASSFPNPLALEYNTISADPKPKGGYFDRILADVPCSGDGTVRKAPDIFKSFDTNNGHILHPVQIGIVQRGLELLKVGGLMVYSTCSLNPVENEAVVAQLLRDNKGSVELVDTSGMVPLLKRRPGKSSWKNALMLEKRKGNASTSAEAVESEPVKEIPPETVKEQGAEKTPTTSDADKGQVIDGASSNKYLKIFSSRDEYEAFKKTDDFTKGKRWIPDTAFPPTVKELAELHLERCMRIMPQDNNTSGFFVCLLRKTGEVKRRRNWAPGTTQEAWAAADPANIYAGKQRGVAADDSDGSVRDLAAQAEAKAAVREADEAKVAVRAADEAKVAVRAADEAKAAVREADEAIATSQGSGDEDVKNVKVKEGAFKSLRDDDFLPFSDLLWSHVNEGFQFDDDNMAKQFFYRSGDGQKLSTRVQKKRRLERVQAVDTGEKIPHSATFTSKEVAQEVLLRNKNQKMHVVGAGTIMLKRNQRMASRDKFRVSQESLKFLFPHMNGRITHTCTLDDLLIIMRFNEHKSEDPIMKSLDIKYPGPPIRSFSSTLQKVCSDSKMKGGMVLALEPELQKRHIEYLGSPCALSVWVGTENLAPMVNKADMSIIVDKLVRSGFITQGQIDSVEHPDKMRYRLLPKQYLTLPEENPKGDIKEEAESTEEKPEVVVAEAV